MAFFPKIQSPCPYKGDLSAIIDGDVCRLCKRQVVDLTAMNDAERVALTKDCVGDVCVKYQFPLRPAIAAAMAAGALGFSLPAAAQDSEDAMIIVVAGGITDPNNVVLVSDDVSAPELPVVYDDAQTEAPTVDASAATDAH